MLFRPGDLQRQARASPAQGRARLEDAGSHGEEDAARLRAAEENAHESEKWQTFKEDLKEVMPVLVLSPDSMKRDWVLGLVQETQRGSDGCVRSATVKTQKGKLRRAVIHLVALPDPGLSMEGI